MVRASSYVLVGLSLAAVLVGCGGETVCVEDSMGGAGSSEGTDESSSTGALPDVGGDDGELPDCEFTDEDADEEYETCLSACGQGTTSCQSEICRQTCFRDYTTARYTHLVGQEPCTGQSFNAFARSCYAGCASAVILCIGDPDTCTSDGADVCTEQALNCGVECEETAQSVL